MIHVAGDLDLSTVPAFDAELGRSLSAEHRRRRARRVHVHRLVRSSSRSSGRKRASPRQAASSSSWRLPNRRAACSRLRRSTDSIPVFDTAGRGPHLIRLRRARRAASASVDARIELHHAVEQRQLEDPAHMGVVDDDPQLRAVRAGAAGGAEQHSQHHRVDERDAGEIDDQRAWQPLDRVVRAPRAGSARCGDRPRHASCTTATPSSTGADSTRRRCASDAL